MAELSHYERIKGLIEKIGALDKSVDPTAILNDEDRVVVECDPELRDALVDLVAVMHEWLGANTTLDYENTIDYGVLFERNQIAFRMEERLSNFSSPSEFVL